MAYYFIFPESDATMYSQPDRKALNTGNDEILELVKERGTTNNILYPSRILMKFKNEDIKSTIRDIVTHENFNDSNTKVNLNLTSVEGKNLVEILNITAYAVSQSWNEGTGRYTHLPTSSNGTSWLYRTNTTSQTIWPTSSFSEGTTGSISQSLITQGGGNWYTGSKFQASQQMLPGSSLDIDMNVKEIVQKWSESLFNDSTFPTGVENQGFIIKKPNAIENNVSHSFGYLQYFSVDTHTINPPKLIFKWDDSTHTYQSSASLEGNLQVNLYRNKKEYNQNDEAIFRIHVRDKYPTRQFASSSNYLDVGWFTTSSYYSIRDAHSEEEIIPFDDNNTKLSADVNGMYFKIYMKGLQPERYYRLLFKHTNNDGTTIYDDNYYFKVIR